jgi:hypothetical protein
MQQGPDRVVAARGEMTFIPHAGLRMCMMRKRQHLHQEETPTVLSSAAMGFPTLRLWASCKRTPLDCTTCSAMSKNGSRTVGTKTTSEHLIDKKPVALEFVHFARYGVEAGTFPKHRMLDRRAVASLAPKPMTRQSAFEWREATEESGGKRWLAHACPRSIQLIGAHAAAGPMHIIAKAESI